MRPKPTPNPNLWGIVLVYSFLFCAVNSDLASDKAALLALRDAVHGTPRFWNLNVSPCNWTGVFCSSEDGGVIKLRLPGAGLIGQLPRGIGNLTQLQTLSLRLNALSGTIPDDFANLTALRYLFFNGNNFSSDIPGFLFNLPNLIKLDLSKNNFSGVIPASVNNSTRLTTLYLEDNQLSGSLPDIDIPSLKQFNVSNNDLTGMIPAKLSGMPASAFEGNLLCGAPLGLCNGTGSGGGHPDKNLSAGAITAIVIGCLVGVLLIITILVCFCSCGKKTESMDVVPAKQTETEITRVKAAEGGESRSIEFSGAARAEVNNGGNKSFLVFFGNASKAFDLDDLLRASAEVLGKGTFGMAYKAALEMGTVVTVKRLKEVNVSEKEFKDKVEVIGSMDHENLVPLRAYYYSSREKLLVYDFMPMGSLSALLHGSRGGGRTPLNWQSRSRIALEAAKGIAYLHSRGPTVSHGNIKSSNILLTRTYEACVSDFGLAQLASPTATPNSVDGYRAPEVTDADKVSQEADVYSFGVFLLELLTGKAPTQAILNEEGVDLPRWVQSIVQEEWSAEVFDPELLRYQNVEEDMVQLLQVAINCTSQQPDERPSMAEVTSQIEEICRSSSEEDLFDDVSSL
ncbi:hypothetical protein SLE2022_148860 [Rubroshorea leprosula]